MLFDFFILFAPPDRAAAHALRATLEARHGTTCFLYPASDEPWSQRLKRAMSDAALAVTLISPQMVAQFLDKADIRVVLELASMGPEAHRIVSVLVNGARDTDVPPALASRPAFDAPGVSLDPVAQTLALELQSPARSARFAFVRTHELMDAVWARVEPASTGQAAYMPAQHGMRVHLDGTDIVGGYQRITASEFDQKLTPARLDHIRRLEKSMELNLAAWEDASRNRAPTASDQEVADRAIEAMSEDLDLVLYLLSRAASSSTTTTSACVTCFAEPDALPRAGLFIAASRGGSGPALWCAIASQRRGAGRPRRAAPPRRRGALPRAQPDRRHIPSRRHRDRRRPRRRAGGLRPTRALETSRPPGRVQFDNGGRVHLADRRRRGRALLRQEAVVRLRPDRASASEPARLRGLLVVADDLLGRRIAPSGLNVPLAVGLERDIEHRAGLLSRRLEPSAGALTGHPGGLPRRVLPLPTGTAGAP